MELVLNTIKAEILNLERIRDNHRDNNDHKNVDYLQWRIDEHLKAIKELSRAEVKPTNENSGLNIPVVIASLLKATDADMLRVGKHDDGEIYAYKLTESEDYYDPWDEEEIVLT